MTEMEAALGIVQFKKLDSLNKVRQELAAYLTEKISKIPGLTPPVIAYENSTHTFFVYALKYDKNIIGISRDDFVKALNAEGIPFSKGYVKPLYLNPIYHEKKPFAYKQYSGSAKYDKGLCPVAERMYKESIIQTGVCRAPATIKDMDDVINAIEKILDNKSEFT